MELAELSALMRKPDIHFLSMTSPGGIVKSRVTLELGHLVCGMGDWRCKEGFDLGPLTGYDTSIRFKRLSQPIRGDYEFYKT